jgi:hypothetical protein
VSDRAAMRFGNHSDICKVPSGVAASNRGPWAHRRKSVGDESWEDLLLYFIEVCPSSSVFPRPKHLSQVPNSPV